MTAVNECGWGDLTQIELGKKIGCSQSLIAKWKRLDGMPGMDRAVSLANCLRVSLDWLMTGNEPQGPESNLTETERKLLKMWRHMTPEVKYHVYSQFALARMTPDLIAGGKLSEEEYRHKMNMVQERVESYDK